MKKFSILLLLLLLLLSGCSDDIPKLNRPQILNAEIYDSSNDIDAELHKSTHWYSIDYTIIKVNNPEVSFVLIPGISFRDSIISGKDLMSDFSVIFPDSTHKIRYIKNNQLLFVKLKYKE